MAEVAQQKAWPTDLSGYQKYFDKLSAADQQKFSGALSDALGKGKYTYNLRGVASYSGSAGLIPGENEVTAFQAKKTADTVADIVLSDMANVLKAGKLSPKATNLIEQLAELGRVPVVGDMTAAARTEMADSPFATPGVKEIEEFRQANNIVMNTLGYVRSTETEQNPEIGILKVPHTTTYERLGTVSRISTEKDKFCVLILPDARAESKQDAPEKACGTGNSFEFARPGDRVRIVQKEVYDGPYVFDRKGDPRDTGGGPKLPGVRTNGPMSIDQTMENRTNGTLPDKTSPGDFPQRLLQETKPDREPIKMEDRTNGTLPDKTSPSDFPQRLLQNTKPTRERIKTDNSP